MMQSAHKEKDFKEVPLDSRNVFRGCLLDVYEDQVRLPKNGTAVREYIKHPGAAVVIPYLGDHQILLIRQYRYPVQRVVIEIPAGKIDPGENPEETIRRELEEETGYISGNIAALGSLYPTVGYSDEIIHLYWADHLKPGATHPDEDEVIELFTRDIDEAMEMVYAGQITDAKSIIGLFWAEKIIRNRDFAGRFGVEL